jgi:hypothetical protein
MAATTLDGVVAGTGAIYEAKFICCRLRRVRGREASFPTMRSPDIRWTSSRWSWKKGTVA